MAYINYSLAMNEFDIVFNECFVDKEFEIDHKHNLIMKSGYDNDLGIAYDRDIVYEDTFRYMLKNGLLSCLLRFTEATIQSYNNKEQVYDMDKIRGIMNKITFNGVKLGDECYGVAGAISTYAGGVGRPYGKKYRCSVQLAMLEYYKLSIDVDTISVIDVDKIVDIVINDNEVKNKDYFIIGIFLDIFKACIYNNNYNVAEYILSKYVLKSFANINWYDEYTREVKIAAKIFDIYFKYFSDIDRILPSIKTSYNTGLEGALQESNDLKRLFSVEKDNYTSVCYNELFDLESRLIKEHWHKYSGIDIEMILGLEQILNNNKMIRQCMDNKDLSKLIIYMLYGFYAHGLYDKGEMFLLQNYHFIDDVVKEKYLHGIDYIIAKYILKCDDLSMARALISLLESESIKCEQYKIIITNLIKQQIVYLLKVKEHIKNNGFIDEEKNKTCYEVIYGNGFINNIIERLELSLEHSEILPDFIDDANHIIYVFSNRYEIILNKLGVVDRYDYSTYTQILPYGLVLEAAGLCNQYRQLKLYINGNKVDNARRSLRIVLEPYISNLECENLYVDLQNVKDLKESIQNNAELEDKINEVSDYINRKIINSKNTMSICQKNIYKMQDTFLQSFNNKHEKINLLDKMPLNIRSEIIKLLSTAEYMYETMQYADTTNLDFSPAMIDMTKALELLLETIYLKVADINERDENNMLVALKSLDKNIRRHLQIKDGKTMSDFICMFKDGDTYKVDYINNVPRVGYEKKYVVVPFEALEIDKVIDISKLSNYKDIQFLALENSESGNIIKLCFNDNEEYNKTVLVFALNYVKNKFRNPVSHREIITLNRVKNCKEVLLNSQYLFWILLDILR